MPAGRRRSQEETLSSTETQTAAEKDAQMTRTIKDVLDLPEKVHRGDFVLNLAEGVTDPEKTLASYVITPQLEECFREALGFVRSAIEEASSKATYLHGSFGSGKSHFMAVLYLLLQRN